MASCGLFVVGQEKQGDVYAMKYDEVFGKISLEVPAWGFFVCLRHC